MRRWVIAGVLAVAAVGCSWLSPPAAPTPAKDRLRPTCADVEQDVCVAESVTLNARQLHVDEATYRNVDRRPVPVHCILRETGLIEDCRLLDTRDEDLEARVIEVLQDRRYEAVKYKERTTLVPYTFLVSFAPPASEAAVTAAVRLEVFRALLPRIPAARRVDGGVAPARALVCVGVGDDVADPPRGELEALRRSGAVVEPASSCWGLMQAVGGAAPFGSVVVREVQLERPDVAQVRAEVGISGRTPEFLNLRASRLGDRWLVEEQPVALPVDAGSSRPPSRVP